MSKQFRILLIIVGISLVSFIAHSDQSKKWKNLIVDCQQQDSSTDGATFQGSIFIIESDNSSYFYYNIYTKNNKVLIKLLHKDLTVQTLTFSKSNSLLQFRDAYDRYVIVQQIDIKTNQSVSFWVLEVATTNQGYALNIYAVDSVSDSHGFIFNGLYTLTQIFEYDHISGILFVVMDSKTDFNIYKIDLRSKLSVINLDIVDWFSYSKNNRETVIGGNSRVFVEVTNNQFWIDQQKQINGHTPSTYAKYNIEDLTNLTIYDYGSRTYNFISQYFQYVSLSKDQKSMSTFAYYGYMKSAPLAQGSLCSNKKPIKFFSDQESYFVAVADNDVYYSIVYWNDTISDYVLVSGTLRQTVQNKKLWPQYIKSFNEALIIVLYDLKFYILTENYLYVQNGIMLDEIQLDQTVSDYNHLERILFNYMNRYLKTHSNNSGGY